MTARGTPSQGMKGDCFVIICDDLVGCGGIEKIKKNTRETGVKTKTVEAPQD